MSRMTPVALRAGAIALPPSSTDPKPLWTDVADSKSRVGASRAEVAHVRGSAGSARRAANQAV